MTRRRRGSPKGRPPVNERFGGASDQVRGSDRVNIHVDDIEASSAPLVEHLMELRTRLIYSLIGFAGAFLVCFYFADQIFDILTLPAYRGSEWAGIPRDELVFIYTAPQEFFFTQLKIGMFGGFFLAFPVIATQIYLFVAPGLYRNERGAFLPFLVATPILFAIGACLVYFFMMPMAMWFFASMQQPAAAEGVTRIDLLPKVSEYLGLIMTLIFAFGTVFQLPVVTSLLVRAGLVGAETLAAKRKYAVVIAFVMAAILTPPDPISQISLAVPTLLLYEVAILAARRIERTRAAREAAREAAA